jgi:outer membrane protein assembly factor BamB
VLGGRNKIVHALDARTGKEVWRYATRAPAIAAGTVVIGAQDGTVYALG